MIISHSNLAITRILIRETVISVKLYTTFFISFISSRIHFHSSFIAKHLIVNRKRPQKGRVTSKPGLTIQERIWIMIISVSILKALFNNAFTFQQSELHVPTNYQCL